MLSGAKIVAKTKSLSYKNIDLKWKAKNGGMYDFLIDSSKMKSI